jgi:hypothetical protein
MRPNATEAFRNTTPSPISTWHRVESNSAEGYPPSQSSEGWELVNEHCCIIDRTEMRMKRKRPDQHKAKSPIVVVKRRTLWHSRVFCGRGFELRMYYIYSGKSGLAWQCRIWLSGESWFESCPDTVPTVFLFCLPHFIRFLPRRMLHWFPFQICASFCTFCSLQTPKSHGVIKQTETNSVAYSPQANYAYYVSTAGRRIYCQLLLKEGSSISNVLGYSS